MWLAPVGYQGRSPGRRLIVTADRMCPEVVAGDLAVGLASLVLGGESRGCIDLLVVGR